MTHRYLTNINNVEIVRSNINTKILSHPDSYKSTYMILNQLIHHKRSELLKYR